MVRDGGGRNVMEDCLTMAMAFSFDDEETDERDEEVGEERLDVESVSLADNEQNGLSPAQFSK